MTGFRNLDRPDLSTPQKAFGVLVETLKTGETESLAQIATETGVESLLEVQDHPDFEGNISSLGNELEAADLSWDAITDDIYVVKAIENSHVHKMEFTRETPGWMLYHWQLGGGVK